MKRLILVTGGARSGKSTFAEELAGGFGEEVLYIATAIPFDDEMRQRIKMHREQRTRTWETLESYKELDKQLQGNLNAKSAVLLDCITIMITNLMMENCEDYDSLSVEQTLMIEENIKAQIESLIETVQNSDVPFILVTNEVGMGIVPENKFARLFRDIAGRVNQQLAKSADEVYLCVSGIPVKIK